MSVMTYWCNCSTKSTFFLCVAGGEDKKTLFVGNVSWNVTEEDIKGHFDGCLSIRLPKRPDGKSRG